MRIVFFFIISHEQTQLNRVCCFSYIVGFSLFLKDKGAQWLSGRVLDLRPRGLGFEPHWRHCIVVLEQDTFIRA